LFVLRDNERTWSFLIAEGGTVSQLEGMKGLDGTLERMRAFGHE
jgi:hypothetical protein